MRIRNEQLFLKPFLFCLMTAAAATGMSAGATTFDPAAQFSDATSTGRVWSYDFSLDGVTTGLTPLPDYGYFDNDKKLRWSGNGHSFAIRVWRNAELNANQSNALLTLGANRTDYAWSYPDAGDVPARSLFLYPPAQGSVALTFTSPGRLTATINYDFTHEGCTGGVGVTYTVRQIRPAPYRPFAAIIDSGTLLSRSCGNPDSTGNKSAAVALEKGDQINFIVRPNAATDNQSDGTVLAASIVTQ
jgi:hypothetical protein